MGVKKEGKQGNYVRKKNKENMRTIWKTWKI